MKGKKAKGTSAIYEKCLILGTCCFCIPLDKGLYVIAGLGVLPTYVCLMIASPLGKRYLVKNGVPQEEVLVIVHLYAVLGFIILLCHILLLAAAITRIKKLFTVYLLGLIVFVIGSFILAAIICIETVRSGNLCFGIVYILIAKFYMFMLAYFWILVRSQLYIVKAEENVVNIHITII